MRLAYEIDIIQLSDKIQINCQFKKMQNKFSMSAI